MSYARAAFRDGSEIIARMPFRVTSGRAQTPEDAAFMSGAALAHLHLVVTRDEVPQALLRARLALQVATSCVKAVMFWAEDGGGLVMDG